MLYESDDYKCSSRLESVIGDNAFRYAMIKHAFNKLYRKS